MNIKPYTLSLLQVAGLAIQAKHPNFGVELFRSYPGPSLRLSSKDTSRSVNVMNAGPYVNMAIQEPYRGSSVNSYYWAASENTRNGFSGLGLQLDLPSSSISFEGKVDGDIRTGVVRLHGIWKTFGKLKDEDFSCYWDIDVRNKLQDLPNVENRVGNIILRCLQKHLMVRLNAIHLEMPSGISSFEPSLELLFSGDYFGSVSKLLSVAPTWVDSSSVVSDATPSP